MLDKIAHLWYTIGVMRKDIPSSKMLGDTKMEKQVKDFPDWNEIRFSNRVIYQSDLEKMSEQMVNDINELYVLSVEDYGKVLYV